MLIEFVQNTASMLMYTLYKIPRSMKLPSRPLSILGTTTAVTPLYATMSGNVAIVGTISLCLHLRSKTSSANPSKIDRQADNSPALYSMS